MCDTLNQSSMLKYKNILSPHEPGFEPDPLEVRVPTGFECYCKKSGENCWY